MHLVWFDNWSDKRVLADLLGARGVIDFGVQKNTTVEEAMIRVRRRRRHRLGVLNEIEEELNIIKNKLAQGKNDLKLWRRVSGYKQEFSTLETWNILQEKHTFL